jgi:predicted nuclease of predicted toxin-antitoxin system
MKFLVDECIGTSMLACLRDAGHDAASVVEVMPQATDEDILRRAVSEGRIVVTNDKDFGELVYRSGWEHCGVVLLRLRDEQAENRVRVMKSVLEIVGERLQDHYTVATETGIRVRSGRGN